ncbi:MAG: flagellar hook-length control protein FliK, partial [Halioglobus sp.]|nr:flagellar hook-length control protein FliK [Halioglobus sp.]
LNLQVTALQPYPQMQVLESFARGVERSDPLHAQFTALLARQGSVLAPLLLLLDTAKRVKILSLLGRDAAVASQRLEQLASAAIPRDPGALREAFENSGFFLESSLLRALGSGAVSPRDDLKSLLLRLLLLARQASQPGTVAPADAATLDTLRLALEGAVAGVTLNQLRAQAAAQQAGIYWAFDLPFRLGEALLNLGVVIRREPQGAREAGDDAEWKVWLRALLPRLGEVGAEIFLRGSRVSVVFHAAEAASVTAIDGALGALRQALEHAAFEVVVLRAVQGALSYPDALWAWPAADSPAAARHVDERI